MANDYIISIEREAKLSIDTGRLEIFFAKEDKKHYVAVIDIAVLIIAHPGIQLSAAVLRELAYAGAVIVGAGDNFMPVSLSLPLAVNQNGARRPHFQAKYADTEEEKNWWRQLIKSKIFGQASVISKINAETGKRLKEYGMNVQNGDDANIESICAKIYWDNYFNTLNTSVKFREKQGATDIVNISLNYAYAIIRAIVARALAGAGLCLNLGVGHFRKDNPFNLAEDFIEPFRFVADKIILDIFSKDKYINFESQIKKELITKVLKSTVIIQEKEYRLFHAVDFAVNSFCISLEDPRRSLLLPNMPANRGKPPTLWDNQIMYED
jgi:CRISPR-associated protein Cas1